MAADGRRSGAGWAAVLVAAAAFGGMGLPAAARAGAATIRPGPARISGPLRGSLTPARSAATFVIRVPRPASLVWTYRGPAVRFVMTDPAGAVDGPGITSPYRLARPGRYALRISSNTMAEGIYGPYSIAFRLRPSR